MADEPDELVVAPRPLGLRTRLGRLVRSARLRDRQRGATPSGRLSTLLVIVLFALMATIGAINAQGQDLRAGRDKDLVDLVRQRAEENKQLQARLAAMRSEVDRLSKAKAADPTLAGKLATANLQAGTSAVKGPAVQVTLTDAPADVQPEGVDDDLLVVHQQDIQMVVNLLWAAGAEAMTIQGQRVVSTTGVKCVGNSVVLHGIPYAPPYQITAIGDPAVMNAAINSSNEVRIYKQYVEAYQLGWKNETMSSVSMPAYVGGDELSFAKPPS